MKNMKYEKYVRNSGGSSPRKSPLYYIKRAIRSRYLREREKRLLQAILREFTFSSENKSSENSDFIDFSGMSLGEYLISENSRAFIDLLKTIVFRNDELYEEFVAQGWIQEDKNEGAEFILQKILECRDRYAIVITMKNKKGSGVVFKDIIDFNRERQGRTLLPAKWRIAKNLPLGRIFLVELDNRDRVKHIIKLKVSGR